MARKDISNKLMIFDNDKKKTFDGKTSYLKRIRGYDTGEEGGDLQL